MRINIPTLKKTWDEDKKTTIREQGQLSVNIDTSMLAHLKWEEQFQDVVGHDLATYTEMVRKWAKDEQTAKARFIGMLKLLYCYVDSEELPTFKDFAKMLDFEIIDEILTKISSVLEEVGKSAAKN